MRVLRAPEMARALLYQAWCGTGLGLTCARCAHQSLRIVTHQRLKASQGVVVFELLDDIGEESGATPLREIDLI